jgi:hypothetical protein
VDISSAKDLTTDNCVSLTVYVLVDTKTGDLLSTFELVIPEDAVEMDQYYSLMDGMEYATFKMNKIMEMLEGGDGEEEDDAE